MSWTFEANFFTKLKLSVETWLLSNDLNVAESQQPLIVDLEKFAALNLLLRIECI